MFKFHGGIDTDKYLDFSVNVPAPVYIDEFRKYLHKAVDKIHLYPSIRQSEEVKALEDIFGCSVVLGNGATQLIYAAVRAIKPERAAVLAPIFTENYAALELVGAEIQSFNFFSEIRQGRDFKKIAEDLVQLVKQNNIDSVFICSPNNPTGLFFGLDFLESLLESSQCKIVVDESFIDFVEGIGLKKHSDQIAALIQRYSGRLLVYRSMTKAFGVPGIRIGYALGSRDMINKISLQIEPWSVNIFALYFMKFILDENLIFKPGHLGIGALKNDMIRELEGFSWIEVHPSSVNFLLFRAETPALNELLREMGINIRTCADFQFLDEYHYRIAIRNKEDNKRLIEALKTIRRNNAF